MRVLTIIDFFTRECLALEVKQSFRGKDVAEILSGLTQIHGQAEMIQCVQGTEFTSMTMDHWANWNSISIDFSRPWRTGNNARNEAFNDIVWREYLSQQCFMDFDEAQQILDDWRLDYNIIWLYSSLKQITPAEFKSSWQPTANPKQLTKWLVVNQEWR